MTEQPGNLPKDKEHDYALTACRRGLVKDGSRFVEDAERLADLPLRPRDFRPMYGTYAQVSAEAGRRNAFQTRSGFIDYLYAPEPRFAPRETEAERLAIDAQLAAYEFVPNLEFDK